MSFNDLFHDDSNVSSYECSQTYVIFLYNEDRTVKAAHYFRDGQEERRMKFIHIVSFAPIPEYLCCDSM